nr:glucan biosynthesis protein [Sulfitobacter sp. W074]
MSALWERHALWAERARPCRQQPACPKGEEFPRFSEVWLRRPEPGDSSATIYAALDSPSVTGAYRFVITPGERHHRRGHHAAVPAQDIKQLGIAPLTSMFLHNGADKGSFDDFRPSVHDSEVLC